MNSHPSSPFTSYVPSIPLIHWDGQQDFQTQPQPESRDGPLSRQPCVRIHSSTLPCAPWETWNICWRHLFILYSLNQVEGIQRWKKKLRAAKTRSRWPFFSIQKLQESLQKQVRSPGLSILCVVLQRNLIQVQQLTQSLWSLRSWPLHCPGVHTSAPGRPNEMQHSESPMKAKTQDFDQTQLAGITTQKSAKCWYHKFTETQAQPCKATDLDASWLGAWWEEKVRSVRWPLRVPIKTRPLCNLPVSKTIC